MVTSLMQHNSVLCISSSSGVGIRVVYSITDVGIEELGFKASLN
jgi:hypothetical protein